MKQILSSAAATVENVTAPAVRDSERYAVAPNMFLELIVNNISNRQRTGSSP
jgi:hypothetical protein